MRLLLIRHAEIPTNVDRRLETAVPGPALTATGRDQAAELAERLGQEGISAVFHSPLARTGQTIAPFLERTGMRPEVLPGLAEIEAGDLEGHNSDAARADYHRALLDWVDGRIDTRVPGGPDGTEVLDRFDAAMDDVVRSGHDVVAVVSHGAVLRAWLGARCDNLDRLFIEQHAIPNTGIVQIEHRAGQAPVWRCLSWLDEAPDVDPLANYSKLQ
ncbi:isomerase [Flexivirga endophytica]|uniref:Isomerase n=1 Tax=Flexivirga endophytica TaxID=1849103 RepID=A0A916SYG7_9MICO|nr:histidine phosphatase family protein [Flexivirga endophytica]GGB20143.1 isomerase [Flexivirga endophytica]GHB35530.1 isomerase [Flexivirga endophytica]